jgi:hypothetical protein
MHAGVRQLLLSIPELLVTQQQRQQQQHYQQQQGYGFHLYERQQIIRVGVAGLACLDTIGRHQTVGQ